MRHSIQVAGILVFFAVAAVSGPPAAAASGIHEAVQQGDTLRVRELIDGDPQAIHKVDDRERTPLLLACAAGNADMVRILLEGGSDTEARDGRGATCLIAASEGRNMEVVRLLVSSGADIDARIESQGKVYNALTVSAMYGFGEFTDYLIERGARLEREGFEITIRYAVMRGMRSLFAYVQKQGLTDGEMREMVPGLFDDAVSSGAVDMVELLIEKGYSLTSADWCGWTPIHHAAHSGQVEMVRYLVEKGVDIGARNMKGESPYDLAVEREAADVASLFAEAGADTSGPVFPTFEGPYMGQTPPGDTPVMFLPGIVSGRDRGHSPLVFSPDGREAYWTEMGQRTQSMMKMVSVGGMWSAPENTGLWGDPGISPGGGRMAMITRVRHADADGGGVDAICYMDRTKEGWGEPVSAGDRVNSKKPHWRPSLDADNNLYFSEFADRMYFSPFSGGEYGEPVLLGEYLGNETIHGYAPFISPDGDYLLFSDENHMYVSFRDREGKWLDRIDMGEKINAPDTASDLSVVTPDGRYIFFLGHGGSREWGIYWVSADVIGRLKAELGL